MSDENKSLSMLSEPENQEESILYARGLCSFAEQMSDASLLICVAYVEFQGDIEKIENVTGFSKITVNRVHRSDLGQRVIGALARANLKGHGVMVALNTYQTIAASTNSSANARLKASDRLLALAEIENEKAGGAASKHGGKDLNTMTLKELQELVSKVETGMKAIESTIDHEPSTNT